MAKARAIPGLSEDDPYAAVAARVVAVRAEELVSNAEGVLEMTDIERVHDMRVATRRLRAALEVFEPCFPRKRFRAVLREVKALADALGERRDRDVMIAALGEFESAVSEPERPGIEGLIERIRDEQQDANLGLVPHVSAERIEALVRMLDELATAAASRAPATTGPAMPLAAVSNGAAPG